MSTPSPIGDPAPAPPAPITPPSLEQLKAITFVALFALATVASMVAYLFLHIEAARDFATASFGAVLAAVTVARGATH